MRPFTDVLQNEGVQVPSSRCSEQADDVDRPLATGLRSAMSREVVSEARSRHLQFLQGDPPRRPQLYPRRSQREPTHPIQIDKHSAPV